MRESPCIQFWEKTTLPLWDGLTLINCGGHFEGGTVLRRCREVAALHLPTGCGERSLFFRASSTADLGDGRIAARFRKSGTAPEVAPFRQTAFRTARK